MTPAEVVAAVKKAGHIIIVHKGAIFFNSHDPQEVETWERKGAILVPFYDDMELARMRKRRPVKQGWEVHILGACERVEIEDVGGDLMDVTKDTLLDVVRAKVAV